MRLYYLEDLCDPIHIYISERIVINNMYRQNKHTQAEIARAINRDPSIISPALRRNGNASGYDPDMAQKNYHLRKLKTSLNKTCHVSTQTIYNWMYKERFGAGLTKFLLFGKHRYKKSAAKQKGALITLIDRKSLYIFADVLENKMAETFSGAIRNLFADLDADRLKTLLFDNGSEMSMWRSIQEMLQTPVFFTHPGRPWEKPRIENANRMLRRFFPKKMQLNKVSSEEVLQAVAGLNLYPRKSLGYRIGHHMKSFLRSNSLHLRFEFAIYVLVYLITSLQLNHNIFYIFFYG